MSVRALYEAAVEASLLLVLNGDGHLLVRDPLRLHRPDEPLIEHLRRNIAPLTRFVRRRDEALEVACRAAADAAEVLHAAGVMGGERLRAAGELLTDAVFTYADGGGLALVEAVAADYLALASELARTGRAR